MAKRGRRRRNPRRDKPRTVDRIDENGLTHFAMKRGTPIRIEGEHLMPANLSRVQYVFTTKVDLAPDLPAEAEVDSSTGELVRLVISCEDLGPPMPASVDRTFRLIEMLVPARLCREELGDAMERIAARGLRGWALRLKLFTTAFWVGVNAIREVVAGLIGKKRPG